MKKKISLQEWILEAETKKISLHELLIEKNAQEIEKSESETMEELMNLLKVMEESIEFGLSGVKSNSNISGGNAKLMQMRKQECKNRILGDIAYDAAVYAIAVAEGNAAMGRIVAAPTAGASGVLPGVLLSLKKHYKFSYQKIAEALNIAGSIGVVIANRASLSGAVGGCQAECGSAAAMAAAAATYLLGGTSKEIGNAVALTIKNMIGLVCDPVAGLVEVPCIKRNAGAATQALLAAQLATIGIESFLPVDEVIDAMKDVGDRMPCALKETSAGGLATCPTALKWAEKYFSKK